MALPQTPEQIKATLEAMHRNAANNLMTTNSVIRLMLAARGFSQLANQGAPYGGYRQATSTLPGYSPYAPHPSPGAAGFAAAFQAFGPRGPGAFASSGPVAPPDPIEDAGIRPGEVRAYRCWRWQHGFLQSMAMDAIWAPGEPMEGGPDFNGRDAGVHAWKTMSKALTYAWPYSERFDYGGGAIIVGQVDLWGDIVEHEHGYRSEFAAIVSLDGVLGVEDRQMLETLCERYGV